MNKHLPFLYLRPILITIVFPWMIVWFTHVELIHLSLQVIGIILMVVGYAVVALTQWQLYKPSQWTNRQSSFEVPDKLVTTGLYASLRNPQLVGIYATVAGIGLLYDNWWVAVYLVVVLIPSAIVAVRVEEPQLVAKFGKKYTTYENKVSRFIPGLF